MTQFATIKGDSLAKRSQRPQADSLAQNARIGFVLLGLLVLLIFVWGGLSSISGAVVAHGRVAVETDVKRVQHKEGGIVSDLLVREGDRVEAGALLIRLDSAAPGASLQLTENQLMELTARRLRLEAERDGAADIVAVNPGFAPAQFDPMLTAERRLFLARRAMLNQQQSRLAEQMTQTRQEIDGMSAELASLASQDTLIDGELGGIRKLYDKGLAPISRLNALEREKAQIAGQRGQIQSSIAKSKTAISEIGLQTLQLRTQRMTEVMGDLKDTQIDLGKLTEQRVVAKDQMSRVEIRAPTSGIVQELRVHTKGGVVGPGETMMLIVPQKESLIVEAKIDPAHIDQVVLGHPVKVRFTSFASQTTPELSGVLDRVSPDIQIDEKSGAQFYTAQVRFVGGDPSKMLGQKLVAGMPAEVYIETARRNTLSYFLKPMTDQIHRSFRED